MDPRCERVVELLWAADPAEGEDSSELREARRHLADCPPCRAYLERDAALAARMRELKLSLTTPCPDDVREAVMGELKLKGEGWGELGLADRLKAHQRRWPAWVEGLMAAAAAVVLIGGGLALSQRLDAGVSDEAFMEDFRRTALPEIVRPGVPPDEVQAFYRAQFDGDGPGLMLKAPVTKVAVCDLEGRMGALVEYDVSGQRMVFYQVPRRAEDSGSDALRTVREGDLNAARWADAKYDYALISAMSEDDLKRLVQDARGT